MTDRKFKLLAFVDFEIRGAKEDKIFKFFLRNEGPYGYDFWRVLRDLSAASKKYHFAIFLKIHQKL